MKYTIRYTTLMAHEFEQWKKEYKEELIKEIEALKKDTTYKNGMCAGCQMDHYDCDCHTHNFAIDKVIKKI